MWFSKTQEDSLQELKVDPAVGLSSAEAQSRLEEYGPNKLKAKKGKSLFQMFLAQLNDWLIYVLLVAVIITFFLQEYVDAVIILAIVILNAILGVVQEVKANNAIEALQKMSSPRALVRRDGEVRDVDSETVVPGDIMILDAGRYVSADLRLIESSNLQIEESALTGESVPSHKDAGQIFQDPKTPIGDRINTAYMSTMVTYGRGEGIVVETGMNTEVGKIAGILDSEEPDKTPLEKRLDSLGKMLGLMAIAICVLMFVVSMLQGRDLAEMFLTSVSLAVAAIPEGLAAIVAVVLSIGVTQMSKHNAIIKKLPAVETLGSVNIICSDKTGTLTQNKMTVLKYFTPNGLKDIVRGGQNEHPEDGQLLAKAMLLCSDATYDNGEGTGDPTEIALLLMADDLGLDRKALKEEIKRIDENPFDSDRKLMSTLNDENGRFVVYTKGAIDNLLKICNRALVNGEIVPITEEIKAQYMQATEQMSDNALRTLGAAFKIVDAPIPPEQMEHDLVLIGLTGMIDPPRLEVQDAIAEATGAGITTIMITGDHKNTAVAIAKELGIADNLSQAATGPEIDEFSDDEFAHKIKDYRVFARVSPEHKVKIVRAYKSQGNIVSMTGDGVNDAPSLNAADIGVAMGITGTDVAKGASDMILTDDNFATIVNAIEAGRNIYNNIKKSVIFLLSCNLGEVVAMFITILMGWPAPLIATQLLWINLVTDSLPAIALGMDPGDPDVMKEEPRDPKSGFFSGGAAINSIVGGILIGGVTIFAFWLGYVEHGYLPTSADVPLNVTEYARSMAFMVLVSCQLFYASSVRNEKKTILKIGPFSNLPLVGAVVVGFLLQFIVMLVPPIEQAFGLQAISLRDWVIVLLLGLIPTIFNEIRKKITHN